MAALVVFRFKILIKCSVDQNVDVLPNSFRSSEVKADQINFFGEKFCDDKFDCYTQTCYNAPCSTINLFMTNFFISFVIFPYFCVWKVVKYVMANFLNWIYLMTRNCLCIKCVISSIVSWNNKTKELYFFSGWWLDVKVTLHHFALVT